MVVTERPAVGTLEVKKLRFQTPGKCQPLNIQSLMTIEYETSKFYNKFLVLSLSIVLCSCGFAIVPPLLPVSDILMTKAAADIAFAN